ncbi:hypothetical protein WA026_014067 [Henosepilachna vigintioctopunctata]|uniref:Polyprenal reductase n=1 Tax=Henosepilachna vigintioctopunctata TaxID=420089 RepID=A0AAW1U6P8_9CUCU
MDTWFISLQKVELASVNIIKFYFLLISCGVIFIGFFINFYERFLPSFILKTFRSGKHGYKGHTSIPTIEFPKSSFKQFYAVGLICMAFAYIIIFSTCILGNQVPKFVCDFLYALTGKKNNVPNVSSTKVFIAATLLNLQIGRRYYETHYVSIFGRNSKINFTHWLIGITYYPMVILALISETPNFTNSELQIARLSDVGIIDFLAIFIFMWAWWHQHVCTAILANLRKTKKSIVDDYKLPMGDWFQYFSSPHYIAEIIMYVALTTFQWQSTTWWFVMLWIFSNQIESILLSHWWYQETFQDFPTNRKALIPCIY